MPKRPRGHTRFFSVAEVAVPPSDDPAEHGLHSVVGQNLASADLRDFVVDARKGDQSPYRYLFCFGNEGGIYVVTPVLNIPHIALTQPYPAGLLLDLSRDSNGSSGGNIRNPSLIGGYTIDYTNGEAKSTQTIDRIVGVRRLLAPANVKLHRADRQMLNAYDALALRLGSKLCLTTDNPMNPLVGQVIDSPHTVVRVDDLFDGYIHAADAIAPGDQISPARAIHVFAGGSSFSITRTRGGKNVVRISGEPWGAQGVSYSLLQPNVVVGHPLELEMSARVTTRSAYTKSRYTPLVDKIVVEWGRVPDLREGLVKPENVDVDVFAAKHMFGPTRHGTERWTR